MEISFLKSISQIGKRVPVFAIPEGESIARHRFLRDFSAEDVRYLSAFEKKSPVKAGHTHLLFTPTGREAILACLPARATFNHRNALLAVRRIVAFARRERVADLAICLDDFITLGFRRRGADLAELIATQCELANFEFTRYKTPPPDGWFLVHAISIFSARAPQDFRAALRRGKVIGEEVNGMRELSNTPGGDLVPAGLAAAAVRAGKNFGFTVKVLAEREMEKLGMGGVLGVGKGSDHPPKFIVIEYWGNRKAFRQAHGKPVVLVGKGVTFDTGGLNLKPEQGIYEMHMDMSGGAAVIHTIAALARLKVKTNVVGIVPAVENMPSGRSYHPGDVLRTMSGKTIEVLNTDAEGRVILADGLTYAKRYKPRLIVDIATLTGAAMSALGQRASALFTTDPKLEAILRSIGEETGDFVWPLPLWEEYEEDVKGTFGDVANVGKTRYGGAITAAMFLWQFVKNQKSNSKNKKSGDGDRDIPWVHLDIAPRMTPPEGEFLAKGSAGSALQLLTHFLRKF